MDTKDYDFIAGKRLFAQFDKAAMNHKLLYFGCPAGFGKTSAAKEWLQSNAIKYAYLSVAEENFFEELQKQSLRKVSYLVLDDITLLTNKEDQIALVKFINDYKGKFVLIGWTSLPSWLKIFRLSKQIAAFEEEDFAVREDEVRDYFNRIGLKVSAYDRPKILKDLHGNVTGILLACEYLKNEKYSEELRRRVVLELFECLGVSIWSRAPISLERLLAKLSIFETISVEMATEVLQEQDLQVKIQELVNFGILVSGRNPNKYHFFCEELRMYMLEQIILLYSREYRQELYCRCGAYYEKQGWYAKAIRFFDMASNRDKVVELLKLNSRKNASDAMFDETEKYYAQLTEEEILSSPDLMCGMSMLASVMVKPEESERWYEALKDYLRKLKKGDPDYELAKARIAYLDIGLPHRGSGNVMDTIRKLSAITKGNELRDQKVSITGNMPSIMNGGLDFSHWSKNERAIYASMKRPIEFLLGAAGAGVADTGLGECLTEKTRTLDFAEPLKYLDQAMYRIEREDAYQMHFAVIGVKAKIFLARGLWDEAVEMVETFRDRMEDAGVVSMLPNIDALRAILSLYTKDKEVADRWMKNAAPDETEKFFVLLRYQYQVKSKIYIAQGKWTAALSLLDRVRNYFEKYDRYYGLTKVLLLQAIVLYRMEDPTWKDVLKEAVERAEKYQFTRIIADEGAAVMDLLKEVYGKSEKAYHKDLISLTRAQTSEYPWYLREKNETAVHFTTAESRVFKLIVQGLTNEKIANTLNISLRTVKFHISNIYGKLGVKNRSQAILLAKENHMV